MIKIFGAEPMFGLPAASPFATKTLLLIKMAGQTYQQLPMNFRKAPKGKLPYIETPNGMLGDSFFIARYLEKAFGADFAGDYGKEDLAKGWTIARMLEEHMYFITVRNRWRHDANFEKGPAQFFKGVPALIRPMVKKMIRNKALKANFAQGMGRHSEDEVLQLGKGNVDAIETLLGSKTYLLGPRMSEVDASGFAFLFGAASTFFESPLGAYIRAQPRIMVYLERIRSQYFPDCKL
jgi:glutathione S-transferase